MANIGTSTVDDVARAALASVGSNAGVFNAIKWTSQRLRQLSNRAQLKSLRVIAQFTLPAAIEDGTITVTRGSDTVAGDSDAETAWTTGLSSDNSDNAATATSQTVIGRYFRFSRVWYKVTNLEPDGSGGYQLRLENPIDEDSATDTTYKLVQRHTPMPPDMRSLGRFVYPRLWKPIETIGIDKLDYVHPERIEVADTGPDYVAEVGDNEDGRRLVELYPYPLNNASIMFTYYKRSPNLRAGMRLPDDFDVGALMQGVLVDIYRFEMSQALRENRADAGEIWRRALTAQEAIWESRIKEMISSNSASDDLSVLLHTRGPGAGGDMGYIRTAGHDALSRLSGWPDY